MSHFRQILVCALFFVCLSGVAAEPPAVIVPGLPQEGIAKSLPPDVAKAVDGLYAQSQWKQADALDALIAMGDKAAPAVPYVVFLCGAPHQVSDYRGRHLTLGALAQILLDKVGKTAPGVLLKEMGDPQSRQFVPCLRALRGAADPAAVKRIAELLSSPDAEIRRAAVESALHLFGKDGHEDVTARFAAILEHDQNAKVRKAVLGVVGLRPFEPGDARDALVRTAWRDPSPEVRAAAVGKFSGTASQELFLAVLASLDKDCCGATGCTAFLESSVPRMRPVLAKLLESEDRDQRQKGYLLLYYYDPDLGEDTVKRLFADPSADLRLAVLRHIAGPRQVAEEHAGTGLRLHGGKFAFSCDGELRNAGREPLREPASAALVMRYALRSGDPETARVLLQARWRKFPIEDDMILAALRPKDTRQHVLDMLPSRRMTAEHLLFLMNTDDPDELRVAFKELGTSDLRDQQLVERSLELADKHHDLAATAYRSALGRRMNHFALFREKVLEGKDDELRRIGYETMDVLPNTSSAVEALHAAKAHPDPRIRQMVAKIMAARAAGQGPVLPASQDPRLVASQKAAEARKAYKEAMADPEQARVVFDQAIRQAIAGGKPSEVVAAVGAAWSHKRRRQYVDPTVPEEACPLLVAALRDPNPAVSDKSATLLARGRCQSALAEVITYLAEHHPHRLSMFEATYFGADAVEPLVALALSHHNSDVRRHAVDALCQALVRPEGGCEEIRNAPVTRQAFVKLMLDAPDMMSRRDAIMAAPKALPEDVCRRVYEKLKKEGNGAVNLAIADALTPATKRDIPPPEANPSAIAELARSSSWFRRQQATVWSATVTWDATVRNAMLELARDRDWRVCESAMAQLGGHLADGVVGREVGDMLASEDVGDQLLALRILALAQANHQYRGSSPRVRQLATSDDSQVRLAVVRAMPVAPTGADSAVLRRLVHDPNRLVAQRAADRTRRLGR